MRNNDLDAPCAIAVRSHTSSNTALNIFMENRFGTQLCSGLELCTLAFGQFLEMLERNTTLHCLRLEGNAIGEEPMGSLIAVLTSREASCSMEELD